jgi:two-component system nitrogen regulation response regulator GlnG
LPALRERAEDIPVLARHFLQQSASQLGVEPKRISEAALARLAGFHFPGNVRQLENICHWLTVMAPAQLIEPKDLPPEVGAGEALGEPTGRASAPLSDVIAPAAATAAEVTVPVGPAMGSSGNGGSVVAANGPTWEAGLEAEAMEMLSRGRHDVWDELTKRFESRLILTALQSTRGRRIEAALKLGIGRNTITRKIQELGLE